MRIASEHRRTGGERGDHLKLVVGKDRAEFDQEKNRALAVRSDGVREPAADKDKI